MTRPSTPPILSELRSSSSAANQVAALRALKNDVIGHELKKEMWIGLGVLAPIARILNSHKGSGKKRHRETNGGAPHPKRRDSTADEEEARLQAVVIVGSFAHGGPAYISPLNAGSVIQPLLDILSPSESSPQAILAALRTLNSIADSLCLEQCTPDLTDDGLPLLLYTEQHLTNLTHLLSQDPSSHLNQHEASLAAALITKTCRKEWQRKVLTQVGVLEALGTQLSFFIKATGGCRIARNGIISREANFDTLPSAFERPGLASILEAVGTIVQNSKYRAIQFLSAPSFTAVLPVAEPDETSGIEKRANIWTSNLFSTPSNFLTLPNPFETLIPQLPNSNHQSSAAAAPNYLPSGVTGGLGNLSQLSRSFGSAIEVLQTQGYDLNKADENSLISWLIYLARAESGATRLMAAWVLAIFYRLGLADRRREASFAYLLMPILVRMLEKDPKASSTDGNLYDARMLRSSDWLIKEQAPAVLAMLAVESPELQRAAVDAGAIKKLSQLLKESYDPLPPRSSLTLWTPQPSDLDGSEQLSKSSRLGAPGLSPIAYHVTRMREEVLKGLAAIASLKDEYRKSIIDHGVVPFVIESLKPSNAISSSSVPEFQGDEASKGRKALAGNPRSVILAACAAARGLSRSVSTLRTSLMDAGLAAPLFVLLKHQDMDIQIAATAVICNLVLEFSPMREAIIEAGILTILCEHARSPNADLRLNSVWALKHLVLTAPSNLKITCLKELGPGWLKQIICNDSEELNYSNDFRNDKDVSMGTPNAAGEQVDLLNAIEDDSRRPAPLIDEDLDDEVSMVDSIGPSNRTEFSHKRVPLYFRRGFPRAKAFEASRAAHLKDDVSSFPNQIRADDLAVQKEGLDFIRNLICGPGAPEMIDIIIRDLGQDKMFDMLAAKLRPRVLNAFSRDRRSTETGVKHLQPQPEIIISVCYIIVHIAAGHPKHRQLLISQPELLKLLVPLFLHTKREIRVCCAWLVINLTWVDDQSDHHSCRARARELLKLGMYEKLEILESDPELDVRERTKTAIAQMRDLLR